MRVCVSANLAAGGDGGTWNLILFLRRSVCLTSCPDPASWSCHVLRAPVRSRTNTLAADRHNLMAEGIQIPSPSVFLRASPSPPRAQPRDDQPPVAKNARRQPSTATTKKAPARKQSAGAAADGVPKPKQSKSRNGIYVRALPRRLRQSLAAGAQRARAGRPCTDRDHSQAA